MTVLCSEVHQDVARYVGFSLFVTLIECILLNLFLF